MLELSKDWRVGHRLWSVWWMVSVVIVSVLEVVSQMGGTIIPLWKEVIPREYYPAIVAALSTIGVVARFIKQNNLAQEHKDAEPESSQAAS